MTTREEYMEALAYNLSDEDCMRLFGVSRDSLEDGSATWNMLLEFAYNEYVTEEEYYQEQENNQD